VALRAPPAGSIGLLESVVHRPRASVLGQYASPGVITKAAAMLHSLTRNHPLADGNKRLAWLATYVFCAKDGSTLMTTPLTSWSSRSQPVS
jgi:death-on-curing protein